MNKIDLTLLLMWLLFEKVNFPKKTYRGQVYRFETAENPFTSNLPRLRILRLRATLEFREKRR